MVLNIRYDEHARHSCDGAFIRGKTVQEWLRVVDQWQVPVKDLVCFIIGEKQDPTSPAGLFVIFRKNEIPVVGDKAYAYTCLAGKLFIPADAVLVPDITMEELGKVLMWEYQLFHPVYGFTGFEAGDCLTINDLIKLPRPQASSWEQEITPATPFPALQYVSIQATTAAEVFDEVKDSVNNKSLDDIPKEQESTPLSRLLNPISRISLLGGLYLLKKASALLAGQGNGSATGSDKPGTLDKLQDWMKGKLEDLERKREDELKRLLRMFEKNTDEALQYAIPLNNPYLNRGESAPSASLSRRSTSFSLGGLGGGASTDFWNVDRHYESLRAKYLKAAEAAIEAGNFKKAAYVYAHLLGDYQAAAGVLERGKYYREAAALYKDHLMNIPAAAACLERGGLLFEAIELYAQLEQYEKAGDLYIQLDRQDKAAYYYEKCIGLATNNKDYLEISRVAKDKLHDHTRAQMALLNGWHDVRKPEDCLIRYFDLVAEKHKERLDSTVQTIYERETKADKKMSFLNVLVTVKKNHSSPEVEERSRAIAYEVMSEQAGMGKVNSLYLLRQFVPDDPLVATDVTRYVGNYKAPVEMSSPESADSLQLMKDIAWVKGMSARDQMLFMGISSTGYYLARANREGHIEYETWNVPVRDTGHPFVLINGAASNYLLFYSQVALLNDRRLAANTYFPEGLFIHCPAWLAKGVLAIGVEKDEIFTAHTEGNRSFLNRYSQVGALLDSKICSLYLLPAEIQQGKQVHEFIKAGQYYLIGYSTMLLRIAADGKADVCHFDYGYVMMAKNPLLTDEVLVYTANGCLLVNIGGDEMKVLSDYFAGGLEAVDMKFIAGKLVIVGKERVEIYTISHHKPILVKIIGYKGPALVSAMATSRRNELALMDELGCITFHSMDLS